MGVKEQEGPRRTANLENDIEPDPNRARVFTRTEEECSAGHKVTQVTWGRCLGILAESSLLYRCGAVQAVNMLLNFEAGAVV